MPHFHVLFSGRTALGGRSCCWSLQREAPSLWPLAFAFPAPQAALPRGASPCPFTLFPQESPCAGLTFQCFFFLCRGNFSVLRKVLTSLCTFCPSQQDAASSKITSCTVPWKWHYSPRSQRTGDLPERCSSWRDSPTCPCSPPQQD